MMKTKLQKWIMLFVLCVVLIMLSSCYAVRELKYYAQKENYVNATGIVTHIAYYNKSTDDSELFIEFSDLTPSFSDTRFSIVGKNLQIVQSNGIDDKLKIGDQVEFISAIEYFGDGYHMPIIAITINGESLLEFEDGFPNYLEWLVDSYPNPLSWLVG